MAAHTAGCGPSRGSLPFDWHATALSNEFAEPQVSSWRDALRHVWAPTLLIAGGSASTQQEPRP